MVRSSVASWITTGTRSLVSFTSISSTYPERLALRNAGIVFSGYVGSPSSTEPPRWAWIGGGAAEAAAGAASASSQDRRGGSQRTAVAACAASR